MQEDDPTAAPQSKKIWTLAVAGALAGVALVPSLTNLVSAQAGTTYNCFVSGAGPFPQPTLDVIVTASASAPPTAAVGETVPVTDLIATVELADTSVVDPSRYSVAPGPGSAVLGPNGSATFTQAALEPLAISLVGGTGSITADGEVGSTVSVTLDQLTIDIQGPDPALVTRLTCDPSADAVELAAVELIGEPNVTTTTTAPDGQVPAGRRGIQSDPAVPARATPGSPRYAG